MGQKQYYQLEGFQNLYLEDSYVLDIQESPSEVVFKMEVVLTEQHLLYSPPTNEQYCYKKAAIRFSGLENVVWIEKDFQKFYDSSSEYDYGNIDSFYLLDGWYFLTGDWGEVKIRSLDPKVVICLSN